jgi:acetyl esterase/lipase
MASRQLDLVVEMLRSRPRGSGFDVHRLRAGLEEFAAAIPAPDGTRCTRIVADTVPCEWVAGPGALEDTILFYLHGGSYVLGSVATHRSLVARLSQACGAVALVVEYRLAPEHPFPAALDDAVRFAERACAAGVDAHLDRWEEMIHVWQAFAPLLPEADAAIDRVGAYVRAHVGARRGPFRAAPASVGVQPAATRRHGAAAPGAPVPTIPSGTMRAARGRSR